jgi:hypothetical protein
MNDSLSGYSWRCNFCLFLNYPKLDYGGGL